MYRGVKFYEAAVKETNGDSAREAVAAAMDNGQDRPGPGRRRRDGAGQYALQDEHVHRRRAKSTPARPRYDVISKADMVDPKEC